MIADKFCALVDGKFHIFLVKNGLIGKSLLGSIVFLIWMEVL